MERSLDIYLSSLDNTHDDYKEIIHIVEEMALPYSQEYLSLLARKGKIDAYKPGLLPKRQFKVILITESGNETCKMIG